MNRSEKDLMRMGDGGLVELVAGVTGVGKLGPALDDRLQETQSVACE